MGVTSIKIRSLKNDMPCFLVLLCSTLSLAGSFSEGTNLGVFPSMLLGAIIFRFRTQAGGENTFMTCAVCDEVTTIWLI